MNSTMEKYHDFYDSLVKYGRKGMEIRACEEFHLVSDWRHQTPTGSGATWEEQTFANSESTLFVVEGMFDIADESSFYRLALNVEELGDYLKLRTDLEMEGYSYEKI